MNGYRDALPFTLPERAPVRQIRSGAADRSPPAVRQPMAGFEDRFTDIVDYIVRITDEIWQDRAIGYIRDTYDPACTVFSGYGVVRDAETVVRSTVASIAAVPDGDTNHLNVAWNGDPGIGFYTAHLGFGGGVNAVPTVYGPATGNRYAMRFAADCISINNLIHTEWLVRDAGACVRQLGFDVDAAARAVAEQGLGDLRDMPAQPAALALPPVDGRSVSDWARALFDGVWNGRRLDRLAQFYAPDVAVHTGGGRELQGIGALSTLIVSLLASIPDGRLEIGHVCWSDEADGVIVAVRWTLIGTSAKGGLLGTEWPAGRPVFMLGSSHLRLQGPLIVEEWTVFDEIATLAMAYRGG